MIKFFITILCLSVYSKGIAEDIASECNNLDRTTQKVNSYWAVHSIDSLKNLQDSIEKLCQCLAFKEADCKKDPRTYSVYLYNVKRLSSLKSYIAHPEKTDPELSLFKKADILDSTLMIYPVESLSGKSAPTNDIWLTRTFISMFNEFLSYVSSDSTIYIKHKLSVMRLLENKNLFVKTTLFSSSSDTLSTWAQDLAKIIEKSLNDKSISVGQASDIFSKLIRDTVDVKTDSVLISIIVNKSFKNNSLKKILLSLVSDTTINFNAVLQYLSSSRHGVDSLSQYFQALTDNIVESISQGTLKPEQLNAVLNPLFMTNDKQVKETSYRDTLLFQFAQTMMTSAKNNVDFMVLIEKLLRKNSNYSLIRKNMKKQETMNIFEKMRSGRDENTATDDTSGLVLLRVQNGSRKLLPEDNDFENRLNAAIETAIKKDALHIEILYEEREFRRMKDEIVNRNKQHYTYIYLLKGCYLVDSILPDGAADIRVQLKMLDFKNGDILGTLEQKVDRFRSDDSRSFDKIVSEMIDNLFSDISENVLISISEGLKNQKKNALFRPGKGVNVVEVIPTTSFKKGRNFDELKGDSIASIGFQVLASTTYPGLDEVMGTARNRIIKKLQQRYAGIFNIFDETTNDTGILVITCKAISEDSISLDFKIADKEYFTVTIPYAINNSELTDPVFNRFFDDMCTYIDDHLMPTNPQRATIPVGALIPAFFPAGSSQLIYCKQLEENHGMPQGLRIPLGIVLTAGQIGCMVQALRYDYLSTFNINRISDDKINKRYIPKKYGYFFGAIGCGIVGVITFSIDNHTFKRITNH